jgi:hypothetical protein
LPRILATSSAGAFLLMALAPFAIVGESWGAVWYRLAVPFSRLTEGFLGFEPYPLVYVVATTLLAAAVWAAVIYAGTRLLLRQVA